jgi:hypothetical protein
MKRFPKIFILIPILLSISSAALLSTPEQIIEVHGQAEISDTVYLPIVLRNYPYPSIFGATVQPITTQGGLDQMVQAGVGWTRRTLSWDSVEPNPGDRDWATVAGLETEFKNAASHNIQLILVLDDTPTWALKPGFSCGAVAEDKLPLLGNFMVDLVRRYSQPPFNIHYYELWNEPDVANFLGCWGDPGDPYFGGGYYANMLQAVYPRIKQADPQAQVLVGGLLLDCDPRTPQANCSGQLQIPPKFLEGILRNGGGNSFDGISFHAYDYYAGTAGQYSNANWNSSSQTTGPVEVAKAGYLRSLLQQYNVSGKYLVSTEVALVCGKTGEEAPCLTQDFELTKSAYLVQSYVLTMADDIKASLWYSTLGWRGSSLLDPQLNPLPAYSAFNTTRNELYGANPIQTITSLGTSISGYEFSNGNRKIWVIWSKDGITQTVNLPATPSAIKTMSGVNMIVSGTSLDVNWKPIFIEY